MSETAEMFDALINQAREEGQRCLAACMNCVYNDQRVNDMLMAHSTLLDNLADALEKLKGGNNG